MLQFVIKILIQEIVSAALKALTDYQKLRVIKKENTEAVNEAVKEKDPQARAKRIADLLNG